MLVNGIHGDQCNLPLLACRRAAVHRRIRRARAKTCRINYGNARVCHFAALALAVYCRNRCLHALITHHIGVLRHGAEQIAVFNQVLYRIRLIEAHTDDAGIARRFDGVARARGGTLVTTEDADYALGDIVLRNALGLRRITLTVLGLQNVETASLECRPEAFLTHHAGICRRVYIDDTDIAGGGSCRLKRLDHLLSRSRARCLVVRGKGRLRIYVRRRIHIYNLHACRGRFFQCRRDSVGAVRRHQNRLIAACNRVVHAFDLLCVILRIRSHKIYRHAELCCRRLRTFI